MPSTVPIRQKLAWALGSLGENYASQLISALVSPVYNIALGLPAAFMAQALAIPRFLDSFAEPAVGFLSDRTQSRWGRRRPFILAGALPLAVLGFFLWLPAPDWSQTRLALYLGFITLGYYLAYAVFVVPYRALGLELSADYNERTRVQGLGMLFGLIGGLGIPWLYKLCLFFGNVPASSGRDTAPMVLDGARQVGAWAALLIFVCCSAPAFFCRESARSQNPLSLRNAVVETLRNRPFRIMLLSRTFVLAATFSTTTIYTPLLIHYLFGGDQDRASTLQGLAGNISFLGAALGVPVHTFVSSKIGKRAAFLICVATAAVGTASQWFTFQQAHPYRVLFSAFLFGVGIQGVWLMCQSMAADVCDEDELRTGTRREGLYGAGYALVEKLGVTAGFSLAGLVAAGCGYSAGTPSPSTLQAMRLALIAFPLLGFALGALLILRYPLSQKRMSEIRSQLAPGSPAQPHSDS